MDQLIFRMTSFLKWVVKLMHFATRKYFLAQTFFVGIMKCFCDYFPVSGCGVKERQGTWIPTRKQSCHSKVGKLSIC
jgi:hypothetical protein